MPPTAIGTLRLTGAAADTPALRLRVARELAGVDLSPPGLPPAAVLVVRRLGDPLPRRLAGTELRLRPDAAWERAVRERLAAMVHAAARPDPRGALPPDAAAVVFADQAELLACAVRERVQDGLAERWWWRAVRRLPGLSGVALGPGREPSGLLAACPREAPAAVARLAAWGEAGAVAAALDGIGARRVLAALAAEHGLPRELVTGDASAPGVAMHEGEPRSALPRSRVVVPVEPWREWLPATVRDGVHAPEVRCLFGVALGLAAAPQRLRAHGTLRQGRRWWRAVAAAQDASRLPAPSSPAGASHQDGKCHDSMPPRLAVSTAALLTGDALAARPTHVALPAADETPAPLAPTASSQRDGWVGVVAGQPGVPLGEGSRSPSLAVDGVKVAGQSLGSGDGEREMPSVARSEEAAAPEVEPEPESAPFGEGAVATRLAGVLYLIHALVDLGLPEAFERGWRLESDAGPWGALDLLARGLLAVPQVGQDGIAGTPPPDHSLSLRMTGQEDRSAGDPLWRFLAELAAWPAPKLKRHRAVSLPTYRVPRSWLRKLADPSDSFAWSAAAGRLRLWSGAGYLLADVPCDGGSPARQARRELARIAGARTAGVRLVRRAASQAPLAHPLPPLSPGCPPRLGRWLAAVLPAVRRRLLLALTGGPATAAFAAALAQPPGRPDDPIAQTLAVPGRIHLTSSHLDVVLPLDAADLGVRRAGLDRDPGWLPGFGRVVCFHFD